MSTFEARNWTRKILFSNIVYKTAFIGGILTGIFNPYFTKYLNDLNGILEKLFQMCVLPIVVCSITIGVSTLLNSDKKIQLYNLLKAVVWVLFIICATGIAIGFIFKPGLQIDLFSNSEIARRITKASVLYKHIWEPIEMTSNSNFLDFLKKSIPANIFDSLSKNKILQVILFSIVFALSLAKISRKNILTQNFEILYEVFRKIFDSILFFLPVLIFCSLATEVSKVGIVLFLKLFPFLKYLFLGVSIIFFLNLIMLKIVLKSSMYSILKDLKISFLVALVSSPIVATLPVLGFLKKYRNKEHIIDTLTPIFLFIGAFGNVLYFILASMVVGQIYGHIFGVVDVIFLGFFSILAGISNIGISANTSVFLGVVLAQMGIPVGPVIVLLSSLDFIIVPFLNILSTQTTVVLLTWGTKKDTV